MRGIKKKYMKVLIYLAGAKIGPSVGIHLEEAIKQVQKGNEVFILNCDKSIGGCMENPGWNPLYCNLCIHFQKQDMRSYMPKGVEQHWISEYVKQIDEKDIPKFEYTTTKELRNLTFHCVEIGLGVMSTYISLTRNLNPKIDNASRPYFNALIREQVITALVFEKLQKEHHFGLVVFQNGRGAQFKSLLNLCQSMKIDFLCTEYLALGSGQVFLCNFFNDIPHSIEANNTKYEECWESTTADSVTREKIARSFYENRRNAVFAGDTIYVKDQVKGEMPVDWTEDVENIVIFNSSEDEFAAISREFDNASFYPSQIDGIRAIVEHYEGDTTKHFTLRVHPNLKNISYKYHQELYQLNYPNLTVIPADSIISTYALMDAANKVIVFGSTAGIESVYWRKPVICLAAAYYNHMNITYLPHSEDDLWKYIDTLKLPCLYNNGVLKYGYFYMSDNHEKAQYMSIDKVRRKFLGRTLLCFKFQKFLGFNFLYALLMGIFYKFILMKFPAKFNQLPKAEQ